MRGHSRFCRFLSALSFRADFKLNDQNEMRCPRCKRLLQYTGHPANTHDDDDVVALLAKYAEWASQHKVDCTDGVSGICICGLAKLEEEFTKHPRMREILAILDRAENATPEMKEERICTEDPAN